ncbi:hypothetical protein [Nocardiopsis sp. LOL_012]|uniref:hypothetical protein n=1 Tax=Nocardiopsis sp. LOL_012 TaxID=3345409 RepID=UPI003A8C2742
MAYSIPALLRATVRLLWALTTPARGRHARPAAAPMRRRRSTRVRRYAPPPHPEQAATAPPDRPEPAPRPAPRLAPAPAPIPAEEVALIRGYYRAFEDERALRRRQAEARARLDRWTAGPIAPASRAARTSPVPAPRPVPGGDLLAPYARTA